MRRSRVSGATRKWAIRERRQKIKDFLDLVRTVLVEVFILVHLLVALVRALRNCPPGARAHRFRHTLATEILARGGSMADAADVLGISEYIARKHYAKWSPARQQRISSIMSLVQCGGASTQPPTYQQEPSVIQ